VTSGFDANTHMGLKIRNLTKNTMLCEKASVADSFWKRAKGLMFQKGWEDFDGLVLSPCRSIHTFGMRMEIDVCFLDSEHTIMKSLDALGPWRSAQGGRRSHATLELPAGTLARTGTGTGDRLVLERDEHGHTPTGATESTGSNEGRPC
jgi:uncharacterized membrane protein (UPF0127 family)